MVTEQDITAVSLGYHDPTDALIVEVSPHASRCVDILLSPDLLSQLFSSFRLSEHAAAGVCSTWSGAYSSQLRRGAATSTRGVYDSWLMCPITRMASMLPGGVLEITGCSNNNESFMVQPREFRCCTQ